MIWSWSCNYLQVAFIIINEIRYSLLIDATCYRVISLGATSLFLICSILFELNNDAVTTGDWIFVVFALFALSILILSTGVLLWHELRWLLWLVLWQNYNVRLVVFRLVVFGRYLLVNRQFFLKMYMVFLSFSVIFDEYIEFMITDAHVMIYFANTTVQKCHRSVS
jgi:hypothetical protein